MQEEHVETGEKSKKSEMGDKKEMTEKMIVLSKENKSTNTKRLVKKLLKVTMDLGPIINTTEEIEIVLNAEDDVLKKRLEMIKGIVKDEYEMEVIE
jgi:hypothetical protein